MRYHSCTSKGANLIHYSYLNYSLLRDTLFSWNYYTHICTIIPNYSIPFFWKGASIFLERKIIEMQLWNYRLVSRKVENVGGQIFRKLRKYLLYFIFGFDVFTRLKSRSWNFYILYIILSLMLVGDDSGAFWFKLEYDVLGLAVLGLNRSRRR